MKPFASDEALTFASEHRHHARGDAYTMWQPNGSLCDRIVATLAPAGTGSYSGSGSADWPSTAAFPSTFSQVVINATTQSFEAFLYIKLFN